MTAPVCSCARFVPGECPDFDKISPRIAVRGDCWEWTGPRDRDGYGLAWLGRPHGLKRAHRAVYEMLVGSIPAGLQLDHLCRNRACVHPCLLEPVTCAENLNRSPLTFNTINARKTHCVNGHEFTAENTWRTGPGRRVCRACNLAAQARYRAKKRARAKAGVS